MNYQQLKKIAAFYGRFTLSFTQVGYRARRLAGPPFKPDYRGQHWLVTGGSGGLGRHIVLAAARAGATVTAVARSESKLAELRAAAAAAGLQRRRHASAATSRCSPTRQRLLRTTARRRAARSTCWSTTSACCWTTITLTTEGRESSFVSNLLSHYQLTEGLLAKGLLRTPGALVINMTSGGGYNVPLNIAMLNMTDPKYYNGMGAYGFHKRAQIVLNQYWRDKYGARGVDVLRDASGLGGHRRREAIAAPLPQDPEVDPARCGIGRGHRVVARRHATATARAGSACGSIAPCGTAHMYERTRVTRRIRRRHWWRTSTRELARQPTARA